MFKLKNEEIVKKLLQKYDINLQEITLEQALKISKECKMGIEDIFEIMEREFL